jgi:PleD family two-component response regulator
MRILLIDDTEDSRDLTEAALLSAGYTDIATAASGWEALKILDVGGTSEERPPIDVVLLDIVMPEMDGVECCARVRNDARYTDLPIIMVTALDDMDSLANAFVAGATDYITKPVNRVELVARVRAALRLKQELDRRQARERELLSFVSNWGDRRATALIDDTTGLFAGEAAEAYLTAASSGEGGGGTVSILAVMLDRFDVYRTKYGDGAARKVLAQVAHAVRRLGATVGIVAAAYRNGTIVLVAPELEASPARALGETLRATVAKLRVSNSEAVAADHITASVSAVTGHVKQAVDRVQLLTQAIARVQDAAGAGGDRVLAVSI